MSHVTERWPQHINIELLTVCATEFVPRLRRNMECGSQKCEGIYSIYVFCLFMVFFFQQKSPVYNSLVCLPSIKVTFVTITYLKITFIHPSCISILSVHIHYKISDSHVPK